MSAPIGRLAAHRPSIDPLPQEGNDASQSQLDLRLRSRSWLPRRLPLRPVRGVFSAASRRTGGALPVVTVTATGPKMVSPGRLLSFFTSMRNANLENGISRMAASVQHLLYPEASLSPMLLAHTARRVS